MFSNTPAPKLIGASAAAVGSMFLLLYVVTTSWTETFKNVPSDQFLAAANAPCPDVGTEAFAACYYDGSNYREMKLIRTDKAIDFDWGKGSPDPRITDADSFAVRWNGDFMFTGGTYTFTMTHDDGMRLSIDGKVVWSDWNTYWSSAAPKPVTYQQVLTPGMHKIGIGYFETGGNAVAKVSWTGGSTTPPPTTPVPPLSSCTEVGSNAFAGCYYNGINFDALALKRTDKAIGFSWVDGAPDPAVNKDQFSVRWNGDFVFDGGTYLFTGSYDDGMRAYVDGKQIINDWRNGSTRTSTSSVALSSGVHKIVVEYYDNAVAAVARFNWKLVSSTVPTTPTTPTTPTPTTTPPVTPPPTAPSVSTLYQNVINRGPNWAQSLIISKLGPSYADLHPNSTVEDRPMNYMPTDKWPRKGAWFRISPYQIGGPDFKDPQFWSTAGQVGMITPDPTRVSIRTLQTFAYYDHVFAIKPRLEGTEATSSTMKPQIIAQVRNYAELQNEALVLMDNGVLQLARLQTSRGGADTKYPTIQFPSNLVPTAIAVTTENQFALVTLWDTVTHTGKLAVVALEGAYLKWHTLTLMGLNNQGSWSDFKLLGYIDLPFAYPTSVAAASNGRWAGPSSTDGKTMGMMDLSSSTIRAKLYNGGWSFMIGTKGYAMISSRTENKVAFYDISNLLKYMKESYLAPTVDWTALMASRGPGESDFPKAFSVNPSIKPTLISTYAVQTPTTVLAGQVINHWSHENYKAYAASEDGNIHIFDASSLMVANLATSISLGRTNGPLRESGSFYACKNPTSMNFARFQEKVAPSNQLDPRANVNALNNLFYIACRGDRKVVEASVAGNSGILFRTLNDIRLDDPVYVDVADRGYVVTVADFNGKKLVSFRIGNLVLWDNKSTVYGPGANGTSDFEVGGVLNLFGKPFTLTEANVN